MPFVNESVFHLFHHPLASLLPFLIFLFLLRKWRSRNLIPRKNPPPSPPRLPVIGNLHQLGAHPHRSFRTLSQKHGDVMLLHLGSRPTVVISSAEAASIVLKTNDTIFANRPRLGVFTRVFNRAKDMVSSPYGEHWRQMRRVCALHLLSNKRIRSFRNVREEEVALMIANIHQSSWSTVDLSSVFMSFANDIICKVAFGKKLSGVDGDDVDYLSLLEDLSEVISTVSVGDFVPWLSWIDRLRGLYAMTSKATTGLDRLFERLLQEHSNSGRQGSCSTRTDFMDVLLEVQRSDTTGDVLFDKECIKGLILDMFAGGTDTTQITLEWMMSLLLKNPRIMKKLQEEVRGSFISNKMIISEDDAENMAYLKAVIKETFRMYSPAPLLGPHECSENAKINGYDVDAGTQVIVNAWSIGRDPKYWDDPEVFYPERFMGSSMDFKGLDFQLIPFGSGRRICPGMNFANVTIEVVMANLLYHFDWALPMEDDGAKKESADGNESMGLGRRRSTPLIVIPTPRETKQEVIRAI